MNAKKLRETGEKLLNKDKNEEIKEILNGLNVVIKHDGSVEINSKECKKIIDCITNLQEENQRLTAESTQWEERAYCWQDRAENLEIIIDKAIEVIDLIKPELWNISNKMTYRLIDVKDILESDE